jgi:hypothetical protein
MPFVLKIVFLKFFALLFYDYDGTKIAREKCFFPNYFFFV